MYFISQLIILSIPIRVEVELEVFYSFWDLNDNLAGLCEGVPYCKQSFGWSQKQKRQNNFK